MTNYSFNQGWEFENYDGTIEYHKKTSNTMEDAFAIALLIRKNVKEQRLHHYCKD